MESPISDHSDSDSGESWTLLDNDTAQNANPSSVEFQKLHKSLIEDTCEKDEDTDGISIISDSEPESPCHLQSSVITLSSPERQAIREEIPVYSSQDIDLETNVTCGENDTQPLVDDNENGDNIKHKIYVHRRNNRLSTVLNIIMLVSVMTAAGVAIGHMWGVKYDCPSQTIPSFNKILSDLYKLQAENANYRNKLRELSLIIEDNLHYECERESEVSLNKLQTANCRHQKFINIRKYLNSNTEEGKRYKRSVNLYPQKQDENKLKRPNQSQLPLQNISKIKSIKKEETSIPEIIVTGESLEQDIYEGRAVPLGKGDKDSNIWKETKISYADSLKSHNININVNDDNVYQNNGKNEKLYKKVKVAQDDRFETSSSEEEFVKDKHTTPKHKLKQRMQSRQKPFKNAKIKNKHEHWDIKEGIQKYYDDMSQKQKPINDNNFVKNKKIQQVTVEKPQIIKESNDGKLHVYDDYFKREGIGKKYSKSLNWYDNRAQLRKEARKRQEQELLNVSTVNSGDWYFKRMHKRQECQDKENSTGKKNNIKKNFKTKPYK